MKEPTHLLAIERKKPKPGRGLLRGVRVPETLLIPAVDGTKPFQPVVQVAGVKWRATKAEIREMTGIIGGGVGGFGIILGAGSTGWLSPHPDPLHAFISIGLSFAVLGGGFVDTMFSMAKRGREQAALARHSASNFKRWLFERYSIEGVELDETAGQALAKGWQPGDWLFNFEDGGGKEFRLLAGEDGLFVEEVPEIKQLPLRDYAPSGTVAALNPAKVAGETVEPNEDLAQLLTGDAQALHARTLTLLDDLGKRQLATESEHVVRRVKEDVHQTLVLNRELQQVRGLDSEAQAQLAAVLSALNDELDEVLGVERNSVKASLALQLEYVKGRRRPISSLQLPPAQVQVQVQVQVQQDESNASDRSITA